MSLIHKLSNGIPVIFNPNAEERASVEIVFSASTDDEKEDEKG